jgi:hypothetical protein
MSQKRDFGFTGFSFGGNNSKLSKISDVDKKQTSQVKKLFSAEEDSKAEEKKPRLPPKALLDEEEYSKFTSTVKSSADDDENELEDDPIRLKAKKLESQRKMEEALKKPSHGVVGKQSKVSVIIVY